MPAIHTLTLGDYQTNTYLVSGNNQSCVIIDPGFEPHTILAKAKELGWTVDAILLTHGHFDHAGAADKIISLTGCDLWIHKADFLRPTDPINHYLYPLTGGKFSDILFYTDNSKVKAAGLSLSILSTPGHTPGSVCIFCEDIIFSGDTLFAGSCGRTDLPGGDGMDLRRSLNRLSSLERQFRIFPGHGSATNLHHEKLENPYLR